MRITLFLSDDFISQKNESSSEFKVGQIAGDSAVLLVFFLVLVGVGAVGGLVFAVVWLMKKRAAGSQGKTQLCVFVEIAYGRHGISSCISNRCL